MDWKNNVHLFFLLVMLLECLSYVTGLIMFVTNFNAMATTDRRSNLIGTVTGKCLGDGVLN